MFCAYLDAFFLNADWDPDPAFSSMEIQIWILILDFQNFDQNINKGIFLKNLLQFDVAANKSLNCSRKIRGEYISELVYQFVDNCMEIFVNFKCPDSDPDSGKNKLGSGSRIMRIRIRIHIIVFFVQGFYLVCFSSSSLLAEYLAWAELIP